MRIISQDREHDVPYEHATLWRDERVIWACVSGIGKIIMAQYSSEEKSEKAMQKLHECHTGVLLMQNVSLPEDEAERLKNMKAGFICVNSREDNVRIEPMHMVFRFPQEDEL